MTRLLLVLVLLVWPSTVRGECVLANPSFELPGTGHQLFEHWVQFGPVGVGPDAPHGRMAARVSGFPGEDWALSGVWQSIPAEPGQRWRASALVWHRAIRPLRGESQAVINVEWRDARGRLISHESHAVLEATSATDEAFEVSVETGAAPSHTKRIRVVLGLYQAPEVPAADVFFDLAALDPLVGMSVEQRQWTDFTGNRSIEFAGRTWRVKGPGTYEPGPNFFCDTPGCVWVDDAGRLHLSLDRKPDPGHSTEIALEQPLGYGDYVFTLRGDVDRLDPNAVLGLFLWEYDLCWEESFIEWNGANEIDVELSRWGDPDRDLGQFAVQPAHSPGNKHRFAIDTRKNNRTSYAFLWEPQRLVFRAWRGAAGEEATAEVLARFEYRGAQLPRPERPRVHMNLWAIDPVAQSVEVVVEDFRFVPR